LRRGKTEWVAIRHAYEAGAPTRSIARDFGVPESSIRARAKLEGWPHGQQYESVEEFLFECLSNPEVTVKDKVRIGRVLLRIEMLSVSRRSRARARRPSRLALPMSATRASTRRQNRHRACCGL